MTISQVLRKGHSTFKSEVRFNKNLQAKNIKIEGLYHGINISNLLMNVTKLGSLNNQKNNYEKLLETSGAIQEAFEGETV